MPASNPWIVSLRPDVSIVIPCFRAAPLARAALQPLRESLDGAGYSWELVIVDDGGGDFAADEFSTDSRVTLMRLPVNRGKGAAVRAGMLQARGRARIFTDVDIPFGTGSVLEIARRLLNDAPHLVIGDRTLPGSAYHVELGLARRAASMVFTAIVGSIVTSGLYDTQCGVKGLRGDVADALFPLLHIDRFAFDVELIHVARINGLSIERVPVRLVRNETSSVRLPRDAVRGALDLVRIRRRHSRGEYRTTVLRSLAAAGASGQPGPGGPA